MPIPTLPNAASNTTPPVGIPFNIEFLSVYYGTSLITTLVEALQFLWRFSRKRRPWLRKHTRCIQGASLYTVSRRELTITKNTPEISVISSSDSGVLIADIYGSVHILNKDFESIRSWVAHVGGRVTHMIDRKGILVTIGVSLSVAQCLPYYNTIKGGREYNIPSFENLGSWKNWQENRCSNSSAFS